MIVPLEEMSAIRCYCDGVVVLANGCFDLLHAGHVRHLQAARDLGDFLIVSLTADEFVNKGFYRPVIGEDDRAFMVDSLKCVDYVYINRLPPPGLEQFAIVRPWLYVKGAEYDGNINPELRQQKEEVERLGGKLVFTHTDGVHTAEIIRRVECRHFST